MTRVKIFGFLFAVFNLFLSLPGDLLSKVKEGDIAPDYGPRDLFDPENRDKEYWISSYVGENPREPKKALVLSFFASYCKPCKKEVPILIELQKQYGHLGLQVLLVVIDTEPEGWEKSKEFLQEQKPNFPCARLRVSKMAEDYFGGGTKDLPAMFVIDGARKVRKVIKGLDGAKGSVEKIIKNLLQ